MNIDWIKRANQENKKSKEILSFEDYMAHFYENAHTECRPTFEYLLDMLEHFGKDKAGRYKLFEIQHPDSPAVFGQFKTQETIFQNLKIFQEEGYNNKFILLVGPNGSSKSSIVRKFMKGAEEYSKSDAGLLFSFSWVFPIDSFVKGSLGLTSKQQESNLKTYAYLEDKDISAILPSELKDHPILLIPKKYRQQILEHVLQDRPQLFNSVKKSYLFRGDLSKRNRMIYDALLKNYKGDHEEVLKHIRVERFNLSKRYSIGAVTIEPQLHVDANLQQITMDRRLGSLPPSLQSLNLFSLNGEAVLANRGILEFSDLLKRPLDAFKYLLTTTETSNINLHGILTELDIFFIGTSNEVHLDAFKQHPDFKSFAGRFNFVRVPYLMNYHEEEKIYHEQIKGLSDKSQFEPHSLKILCLFAVMTRLRAGQQGHYSSNEALGKIVANLTPLEKALIYAGDQFPEKLDVEAKQILSQGLEEISLEFQNDDGYEGKFGISPREMKKIIYKLTARHNNITVLEIIEFLEKFIQRKSDFDFLNIAQQGDYHNPPRIVDALKDYSLDLFDKELREGLGLVDDRSYEDYIRRYIQNINALIKGEKIKNDVTGKYEKCDEYFIQEFEKSINLKEDAEKFRSHLISKLGAYYLDNPQKTIVYSEVFPDLTDRLQQSFREEQNKLLKKIADNVVYYEAELTQKEESGNPVHTPLSKDIRENIKTLINNLMSRARYSQNGAITMVKYILKSKY